MNFFYFIEIFQIIQLHTSLHNGLVKYDIVLEAWIIKAEIISNKMYVIKRPEGHQNTDIECKCNSCTSMGPCAISYFKNHTSIQSIHKILLCEKCGHPHCDEVL